jgi:hypothetical protein
MSFSLPTPGRLLYLGYYLPLGVLGNLWRDGGYKQRRLTAAGNHAMIEAARLLPPLPAPPPDAPEIHFLTGARFWHQTAFLLTSLAPHLPVRPVIHDDGSLVGQPLDALLHILPHARIMTNREASDRLDKHLPAARYPRLRARRAGLVLFRKLIDVHLGARGWNLFLDSDQLCLRRPDLLIDWLAAPRAPLHMTDVGDAYGCPVRKLTAIAGRPVPRRVNTGILGLRSDSLDWDRLEWFCARLDELMRPHYYHEQAVCALHLASCPERLATPLEDYVVLPRPPEATAPRAVWHHYVAASKRWYYQQRWRDFAAPPPAP